MTQHNNKMEITVLEELEQSTIELLGAIAEFSPEQFNQIPFEGSWTPAEVAEHLLKSEIGLPSLLTENTKAANRPVDEHMKEIGSLFLDFNTKYQAIEFNRPSGKHLDRDTVMQSFAKSRAEIKHLAGTTNLSLCCMSFKFPGKGELTGWEWIYLVAVHTKRHARQLRNILSIMNRNK